MERLTHWKKEANKDFLGSWSLTIGADENDKPVYREVVATIVDIKREAITDMEGIKKGIANAKKDELLVYFAELDKPMVIHAKTNFKGLEAACGSPFIERWIGKQVLVYVEKDVKAFGTKTDALRIKPVPKRLCDVCGNIISESTYNASISKYGKALCSKNCLEKVNK